MTAKRKMNPIFSADTQAVIQDAVQWAETLYADANANLDDLIISAGYVSGYGKSVAHASSCGIIELTEGNSFSEVAMARGGYVMRNTAQSLFDLVVHEVAHVIVGWAETKDGNELPWHKGTNVSASTHQCASWIWVCAKGWSKHFDIDINPEDVAAIAKDDEVMRRLLSGFGPSFMPKRYLTMFKKIADGKLTVRKANDCRQCGTSLLETHKANAKFCGGACRSKHGRAKAKAEATAAAA